MRGQSLESAYIPPPTLSRQHRSEKLFLSPENCLSGEWRKYRSRLHEPKTAARNRFLGISYGLSEVQEESAGHFAAVIRGGAEIGNGACGRRKNGH